MVDFDQAVEDFWQARHGGPFPVRWKDELDRETGYRINLALIDRHAAAGNPQVGWKVALTSRAIRAQAGATSPGFAVLYEQGRWPSGVSCKVANLIRPGWENELCLRMKKTLKGPKVSEDEAADAVATVAPALELIEQRAPQGPGGFALSAADNGQQKAFIVGDEVAFDPAVHKLGETTLDLYVNGKLEEQANGTAVMDSSPIASITWLVEGLHHYGYALEAGSVVMTGSFTKQYRFDSPVDVDARFSTFGAVTAHFV